MRDPNRINRVCKALAEAWMCYPDQRFGQFLSNYFGEICRKHDVNDIFFPEDDEWKEWFKEFAKENKEEKH